MTEYRRGPGRPLNEATRKLFLRSAAGEVRHWPNLVESLCRYQPTLRHELLPALDMARAGHPDAAEAYLWSLATGRPVGLGDFPPRFRQPPFRPETHTHEGVMAAAAAEAADD